MGRQRPIIEGEDYLLVSEREGLRILHRAEPHVVGGCDDKYPAGAERVGICRTALCVRGDWERAGNANRCRDSGDSVRPDLLHIWPNPELTLIVNVLRRLWKPNMKGKSFFSGVPAVWGRVLMGLTAIRFANMRTFLCVCCLWEGQSEQPFCGKGLRKSLAAALYWAVSNVKVKGCFVMRIEG